MWLNVPNAERRRSSELRRICEWCFRDFATTQVDKRYCDDCRDEAYRAKAHTLELLGATVLKKRCKCCGKAFSCTSSQRVYCSRDCYGVMRRLWKPKLSAAKLLRGLKPLR